MEFLYFEFYVFYFSDFRDFIKGFETFSDGFLRSPDYPCPEGEWDPVRVISLHLRMNFCSKSIQVESAELILGS